MPDLPKWMKPDRDVILRALIIGGAILMMSAKFYLLANLIHILVFFPVFILTFLVFLKLPAQQEQSAVYKKRSLFDLGILVLLGFMFINEIWSETDIVSIALIFLMMVYSWLAFGKPGAGELFKKAAMPESEILKQDKENSVKSFAVFAVGMIITAICLFILEKRDTFFFTTDDNLVQFLPNINLGAESFFSGVFPSWNPWQCLGTPLADQGIYALTYPPTYLSYYIAKNFLGSELLTLEVFASFHILAGYAAAFYTFRKMGSSSLISAAGAVSFVLSGYILIAGRSWFYMLPLALWLPLFVLIIHELLFGKPGVKWTILSGLAIGLFFHAGNVQMWFYAMMFLFIPVLVLFFMGKAGYSKIGWLICAATIGIAVAAPLLLPQLALTRDLNRSFWGIGIIQGIAAFVFPSPICKGMSANDLATSAGNGHIYYSGTVFFLIAYILFFFILFYRVSIAEFVKKNIWYLLAAVAFVFGIGKAGVLWTLALDLPMFSKFSHPFKLIPYITIFVITGGVVIIERVLGDNKNREKFRLTISCVVFLLMIYHCFCPIKPFYIYADKPYGKLPDELIKIIKPDNSITYRIANASEGSVYEVRSEKPGFYNFAPHDYPTVFRIPSAAGYEPFVAKSPVYVNIYDALEQRKSKKQFDILKACSVKWFFVYGKKLIDEMGSNTELKKIYQFPDPDVAVFELSGALPVAYEWKNPEKALPVEFSTAGAFVNLNGISPGSDITISILNRPGLKVESGGNSIEMLPEKTGLVHIKAPQNPGVLTIKYEAPWKKGIAAGIILLIGAFLMMAGMVYSTKKSERNTGNDNNISQSEQNN
ncbi:MAG: hypothetical protein LWY06_12085 [Firmicutes bacterium]|nr:hypothetical protein [Bacillota bacterium]